MSIGDEFSQYFNEASFAEKIDIVKMMGTTFRGVDVDRGVCALCDRGYLTTSDKSATVGGGGEHYVYLWKHAWGDPFYVGSGKGSRWRDKWGRCDGFYPHIDVADAVVYLVLTDVDGDTARMFETYVSVNLTKCGYSLVNGDNNVMRTTDAAAARLDVRCGKIDRHPLAGSVQNTVLTILQDRPNCDYRVTCSFREKYGLEYFSRMRRR